MKYFKIALATVLLAQSAFGAALPVAQDGYSHSTSITPRGDVVNGDIKHVTPPPTSGTNPSIEPRGPKKKKTPPAAKPKPKGPPGKPVFTGGKPKETDVEQHNDSCWMAAALQLIARKQPASIKRLLKVPSGQTFVKSNMVTVTLPNQKAFPASVDITKKKLKDDPKEPYYDMRKKKGNKPEGPWWVAAVEAAIYKAYGNKLDVKNGEYCGGTLDLGLQAVLGGSWTTHVKGGPLSWEDIRTKHQASVDKMALVGTLPRPGRAKTFKVGTNTLYYAHAYGVTSFDGQDITLMNPHDGSKQEFKWKDLTPHLLSIAIEGKGGRTRSSTRKSNSR